MKFPIVQPRAIAAEAKLGRGGLAGFTMIEIAICLAIIGIALVAIIGVLPLGMRTQRDNREETIINQDASILLEAIRNGSVGQNDLTNYVYAITNYRAYFPGKNQPAVNDSPPPGTNYFPDGAHIVGMLTTPQFVDTNLLPIDQVFNGGYSNHIVAFVRSMSGYAVEKPPQNNEILVEDSLTYRVYCVNEPLALDTNAYVNPVPYNAEMVNNLHELRLRFIYPTLPNGGPGNFTKTYRTQVAGRVASITNQIPCLYFYQPQNYTNTPSS
jgi:prepilin-type N-terminal cleavage/methylation domain-containing protein